MKIWDNGILRDMTLEEIEAEKKVKKEFDEFKPPQNGKSIMEEFIDRVAKANSLSEVKEIAKDIKERM